MSLSTLDWVTKVLKVYLWWAGGDIYVLYQEKLYPNTLVITLVVLMQSCNLIIYLLRRHDI